MHMKMEFHENSMLRVSIHVLSILLNGAIFRTLINKNLFRCPSNRFVLSLATSHILVSFLTLLLISLSWFIDTSDCLFMEQVNVYVIFGTGLINSLTLTIISCERYITIARPMRYKSVVTTTRCSLIILTMWILSACVTIIPLVAPHQSFSSMRTDYYSTRNVHRYFAAVFTITTFLCIAVMSVCYYVIFTIAKEKCHHVQIGQFTSSISSDWPSSAYPSQVEGQKPSSLLQHVLKVNIRHANEFRLQKLEDTRQRRPIQNSPRKTIATIFALIGSLVITQFPMTLSLYSERFWSIATGMLSLAAVFNPILYGFLNRKIRLQLCKTFRIHKKPCRRRLPDCCSSKQQSIRSDIIKELVQDSHKIILASSSHPLPHQHQSVEQEKQIIEKNDDEQKGNPITEMMTTTTMTRAEDGSKFDENKNKLETPIPPQSDTVISKNDQDEIAVDSSATTTQFPRKDSQDSGADMTFSDEEEELASKAPNVFIISKKNQDDQYKEDDDDDDDDQPSSHNHHQV